MNLLKLISLSVCVCLAIYVNSIQCDEDDSLQYDGETSMSNIDDANKEMYEDEISVLPDSGLILEHEMIYEQSDQPVSGERFIAIRVNKMGAAENLKTNLVGLSNMAIQFLPKDYKLIEIIEATREIVSGVRYELLIAARDGTDDIDVICRLVITEITWKLTAWGDKQRILDYSNCTSNATNEDNVPKSNDFNFNPLFVTKTNFINEDDLKLIEAQIIKPKEKIESNPKHSEMSDFDLGNLEAMIIPSKPLSKSDAKVDNKFMENAFQINSPKVSQSETVRDCNQPIQETRTDKSETLRSDFIVSNSTTEKIDQRSSELLAETLIFQKDSLQRSTEKQFVSAVDEEDPKLSNQENSTTKTDEFNSNDKPSDTHMLKNIVDPLKRDDEQKIQEKLNEFRNDTEITLEASNLPMKEAAEPLRQFTEEQQTTEIQRSATDTQESNGKIYQYSDSVPKSGDQIQPHIENIMLQMEDSIMTSTQKTIVIFDKMQEDEKATNEYNAYKNGQKVAGDTSPNERAKRDLNTEMIYLEHLVNESLEQLDYVDSDNLKRVALDILRVKRTEEENGAVYVIKVKAANSNCPEESNDPQDICLEDIIEDTIKVCFIEVKSKRDVNKVTKSECAPVKREKNEFVEKIRTKRGINQHVGAASDTESTEATKIENLVTDALAGLTDGPKYGLHRIKSSKKQIVAGVLYKVEAEFVLPNNEIKDCKIDLVVKAWIKPEPDVIKLDCGQQDEATRKRRSLFYDPRVDPIVTEYDKNITQMFNQFKSEFNRNYESAMEHDMRLRIFKNNLYVIDELNRKEQGTATYGITDFADYTLHEYKQRTGLLSRKEEHNEIPNPIAEIPNIKLPASFDWRDKGAVTEVKNQGSCGSCWAFSVTGNIEGLHYIKTGKLEEYSEQELIDCDTIDQGCNGGLPDNAYKAIEQLGGLESESEYPYSAKKSKCDFNSTLARVKISGAVDLPKDETAMAQYLVQNGPLSIGINANAMQFYRGGISHPPRILCRHSSIDHGVLIVGYGVSDYPVFNKTLPFWIVKNSWGPKWGESGYYRVFRGADTCGLTSMVSSAVLE